MIDLLSVFNELVLMQKSHQHCTLNLCHVEHLSGGCCFRTGPAVSSNKAVRANTKPGSLKHFTQNWPFLPPQPIPWLTASTASGGQDGKRQQEALSLLPLQPSSTQTSYTLWYCLWRFTLSLDPEGFPIKPSATRSPGEIPTHNCTAQHCFPLYGPAPASNPLVQPYAVARWFTLQANTTTKMQRLLFPMTWTLPGHSIQQSSAVEQAIFLPLKLLLQKIFKTKIFFYFVSDWPATVPHCLKY